MLEISSMIFASLGMNPHKVFAFAEVVDKLIAPEKRLAVCLVGRGQKALPLPLPDKRDGATYHSGNVFSLEHKAS
jgi:hypothetical protein